MFTLQCLKIGYLVEIKKKKPKHSGFRFCFINLKDHLLCKLYSCKGGVCVLQNTTFIKRNQDN